MQPILNVSGKCVSLHGAPFPICLPVDALPDSGSSSEAVPTALQPLQRQVRTKCLNVSASENLSHLSHHKAVKMIKIQSITLSRD